MNKIAKVIRVITVAPIMAIILTSLLFLYENAYFRIWDYIMNLAMIVILPVLSYPAQRVFKIFKGDMRCGERKLAIIFSCCGYTINSLYLLFLPTSNIYKIMVLTYLFSGWLIFIFTFIFKSDASGHMCGVSGPVALLFYAFGTYFALFFILLIAVGWSSIYLKRHNIKQLLLGTFIPWVSLIVSILIIGGK